MNLTKIILYIVVSLIVIEVAHYYYINRQSRIERMGFPEISFLELERKVKSLNLTKVLNNDKIKDLKISEKGIFTKKNIEKGEILLYITGKLLTHDKVREYEKKYPESKNRKVSTINLHFQIDPEEDSYWDKIGHGKNPNVKLFERYYSIENNELSEINKFDALPGEQITVVESTKRIFKGDELFLD
jgi:hypothetical protein